jgi:hypothetical protein
MSPNVKTVKGMLISYHREHPVQIDFRLYNNEFEWDLLGDSIQERALRAGVGVGFNILIGEEWSGISPFYGKVTVLYALYENLFTEASLDIYPVLRPDSFSGLFHAFVQETSLSLKYEPASFFRIRASTGHEWVKAKDQELEQVLFFRLGTEWTW